MCDVRDLGVALNEDAGGEIGERGKLAAIRILQELLAA